MSNNPVQPNPIPIPPMPAEIHQAEQRAQEWLKQHEDVPQLLSRKHLSLGRITALVFLLVTLPLTVLVVSQQNKVAELRSQATLMRDPNPLRTGNYEPNSTPALFHSLTRTYHDAKVINIKDPKFDIQGVAFIKYDKDLDNTFVFSSVSNLPVVPEAVVQLWLNQNISQYTKAGVAEFHLEGGKPVAYSVFTHTGDLTRYDYLLYSYDTSPDVDKPESIVLRLELSP